MLELLSPLPRFTGGEGNLENSISFVVGGAI